MLRNQHSAPYGAKAFFRLPRYGLKSTLTLLGNLWVNFSVDSRWNGTSPHKGLQPSGKKCIFPNAFFGLRKISLKATTLIELFISIAILSVIAAGVLTIFGIADKTWNMNRGLVDLQQEVRPVIDGMLREIRQASNITLSDGGARLAFNIPDVSNNITYYLNGTSIIREHPAGTARALVSDINNLTFSQDLDVVQIQIKATNTVRQKELWFNLTDKVRLRN